MQELICRVRDMAPRIVRDSADAKKKVRSELQGNRYVLAWLEKLFVFVIILTSIIIFTVKIYKV